ncbi:unnamed protein product, partial [Hymenolepis diminuta]
MEEEELCPLNWLEKYKLPSLSMTDEFEYCFNPSNSNKYFSFSQMAFLAIENSSRKYQKFSAIVSFCIRNFTEGISFEAWKLHLKQTLISNPAFIECFDDLNSKEDTYNDSIWTYRFEYR